MPYYGDYYGGDYYRGDPGFLSGLGKLVKGVAGTALAVVPGGGLVRTAARIGGALLKRAPAIGAGLAAGSAITRFAATSPVPAFGPPQVGMLPRPGLRGRLQRFLPGGETGYYKRRRMNPANPKALRRALRRVAGFGKLARRARRDIGRAASAVGVQRRSVRRAVARRR